MKKRLFLLVLIFFFLAIEKPGFCDFPPGEIVFEEPEPPTAEEIREEQKRQEIARQMQSLSNGLGSMPALPKMGKLVLPPDMTNKRFPFGEDKEDSRHIAVQPGTSRRSVLRE